MDFAIFLISFFWPEISEGRLGSIFLEVGLWWKVVASSLDDLDVSFIWVCIVTAFRSFGRSSFLGKKVLL